MPTLTEALKTYIQVPRRPKTNEHYELVLGKMIAAIGPARDVSRVTYEDLQDYQAALSAQVSDGSVAHYTNVIKIFFAWCTKRRYTPFSPAVDLVIRMPERDSARQWAMPANDIERIVEYTRITSPRNYAIILFLVDTGCRVGALCSLSRPNLYLEEGLAFVQEKGGRWHKARFGEETAKALAIWLEKRPKPTPSHDYIWTSSDGPAYAPLKTGSIQQMFTRVCEQAGTSKKWSPHSLRHSVGEAYANAGIPVTVTQKKLGHSDPNITMRAYYPNGEEQVDYISKRFALLSMHESDLKPQPAEQPRQRNKKIIPF